MKNQIMFIVGVIIFVIYVYFLLTIIRKQHKIQRKENMNSYDSSDFDGIGNQGRIPDKDAKNRAP
jgi:Ca2+/Na+ antiporter